MVVAIWNGRIVAQSERTVVVEGNHYFPPEALNSEYFSPSNHHSFCPGKGTASYYDVAVGGERNANAAWFYPHTTEAAKAIEGHVAFWHGVEVTIAEPFTATLSA